MGLMAKASSIRKQRDRDNAANATGAVAPFQTANQTIDLGEQVFSKPSIYSTAQVTQADVPPAPDTQADAQNPEKEKSSLKTRTPGSTAPQRSPTVVPEPTRNNRNRSGKSAAGDIDIAKQIESLCRAALSLDTFLELYQFVINATVRWTGSQRIILLMESSIIVTEPQTSHAAKKTHSSKKSHDPMESTILGIADSIGVAAADLPQSFHFSFGKALTKMTPLALEDFRNHCSDQQTLKKIKKLSIEYVLPLLWGKKLQGLILIGPQIQGNSFHGSYSSKHKTFLQIIQALASICGSRIEEKGRLENSIENQTHKEFVQDYVLRIVTKMQAHTDVNDLIYFFRDLLEEKFQVRSFSLFCYNSLEDSYKFLDQHGLNADLDKMDIVLKKDNSLIQTALQQKEEGLSTLPNFANMKELQRVYSPDDLTRMTDCILVPFFHEHKQLIFLLVVHSAARPWTQVEVLALQLFSRLAAWPIARMLEKKEIFLASHDSYTPFERRLYYEYRKCLAKKESISLIDIRLLNTENNSEAKISIEFMDAFFKELLTTFHQLLAAEQSYHRISKYHFILVLPSCKRAHAKNFCNALKKNLPKRMSPTTAKIRYQFAVRSASSAAKTFADFVAILN